MLRKVGAFALAAAFATATVGVAFADSAQHGALAPGKPASVKQAAMWWMQPHWVWIAGIGWVAIGFGLAASGSHQGMVGTTTTCPFSGCPTPPNNGGTTTTTTTPPTTTTTTTTTTTGSH